MAQVYAGTSGFAYKEWRGGFYPEDLAPGEMLRYYASRLPAVEINNTFYRLPREAMLVRWGEEVPEGFTFALKASRRITHEARLEGAEDALDYLLRTAAVLGAKLGPILFQLPPYLRKDLDRFRAFLALLPPGVRAAFEFRHASWEDDEVHAALREHGAALCQADSDEDAVSELVPTARWGYLRLRRSGYSEDDLRAWAQRIRDQPWAEAFVFFKHEDEAAGPRLAEAFNRLIAT